VIFVSEALVQKELLKDFVLIRSTITQWSSKVYESPTNVKVETDVATPMKHLESDIENATSIFKELEIQPEDVFVESVEKRHSSFTIQFTNIV
jgi:hypothetical protein